MNRWEWIFSLGIEEWMWRILQGTYSLQTIETFTRTKSTSTLIVSETFTLVASSGMISTIAFRVKRYLNIKILPLFTLRNSGRSIKGRFFNDTLSLDLSWKSVEMHEESPRVDRAFNWIYKFLFMRAQYRGSPDQSTALIRLTFPRWKRREWLCESSRPWGAAPLRFLWGRLELSPSISHSGFPTVATTTAKTIATIYFYLYLRRAFESTCAPARSFTPFFLFIRAYIEREYKKRRLFLLRRDI